MANKDFGVREINLINDSGGTPNITSPNNLNLNATAVAISTDVSVGGEFVSDVIVGTGYSVGIGSTQPTASLDLNGDAKVGVDTSRGLILTDSLGTQYRVGVTTNGTLFTLSI
jgi:hypothetical protein